MSPPRRRQTSFQLAISGIVVWDLLFNWEKQDAVCVPPPLPDPSSLGFSGDQWLWAAQIYHISYGTSEVQHHFTLLVLHVTPQQPIKIWFSAKRQCNIKHKTTVERTGKRQKNSTKMYLINLRTFCTAICCHRLCYSIKIPGNLCSYIYTVQLYIYSICLIVRYITLKIV